MKRRKKKGLDKNIREELLKSKHKIFYKGYPAPFSQVQQNTRQIQVMPLASYLRMQMHLQSFQGWNTKYFVLFSKHPQQIKCTSCVSLEFATVQLICGILSHSLLPQSTQLASTKALSAQRTHTHTQACTHSCFPSFHFVLNYVPSLCAELRVL